VVSSRKILALLPQLGQLALGREEPGVIGEQRRLGNFRFRLLSFGPQGMIFRKVS
jgi:hypothetical protein